MDNVMSIAAAGMDMNASRLQQDVNISVLKKAMNVQESQAAQLIEAMDQTVQAAPVDPSRLLDIRI